MQILDKTVIRCDRVTKTYTEGDVQRTVLHDITITVTAGEFVVLLGKSGSGKSTLLNLVSGIDTPTSGTIWVAGQRLDQLSERERTLFRRRSIGFVFQFYNLAPTLTALENVLLPLELNGQRGVAARSAALAMLDAVGLANRAHTYPDRLSGGEQQRVAIARALVHNPDLVLADEPTGNLDSDTGAQVLDLLDRLTRQVGKTLVMVTHSREMIGVADRVLQLRNGRMFEEASLPIQ
ncbi:ABC transporter related [Chloroflexus aggregans DSM 9485]|uniref:ABC transporter related n=1 Tax=Chloroflexus aggregans (strain MD-66 / DSM 9485) TaxID=326427 RepID=B8G7P3_CHLAD|nr:ABC transporter related [Chloroflexus aggregans DSM 9485]